MLHRLCHLQYTVVVSRVGPRPRSFWSGCIVAVSTLSLKILSPPLYISEPYRLVLSEDEHRAAVWWKLTL